MVKIKTAAQLIAALTGDVPTTISALALGSELAANLNALVTDAQPFLWDGTTWNRHYGNVNQTVLLSAVRNATTNSSDQQNYNGKALLIHFNITVVPGVDTVTLSIEVKDPVSGAYTTVVTGSAKAAAGTFIYVIGLGAIDTGAVTDGTSGLPLSRTWRVKITHSAGTNFTYSVGACIIV